VKFDDDKLRNESKKLL